MKVREVVSRDLQRLPLGEGHVDYLLVRRRGRRGVGLKVDGHGLTVSAPSTWPLARIESAVRENERWIMNQRLGQLHSLLHSGGVSANRAISLLEQPYVSERVCRTRPRHRRRKPTHLRHVRKKFRRAMLCRQTIVLRHVPDTRAYSHSVVRTLTEYFRGP